MSRGDGRSTTERGYGSSHQQERKHWAPKVDRGEVYCARCGRWIQPGTPWDLGHDDFDRTIYTGPEHSRCNRATAGRRSIPKRPLAPRNTNTSSVAIPHPDGHGFLPPASSGAERWSRVW